MAATNQSRWLADVHDPAAQGPYAVGLTKLTFTRPATAGGAPREMPTWIWYPASGAPTGDAIEGAEPSDDRAPNPVVVFSHGSGAGPDNQTFLLEHLASFGFIVAAMPHQGTRPLTARRAISTTSWHRRGTSASCLTR